MVVALIVGTLSLAVLLLLLKALSLDIDVDYWRSLFDHERDEHVDDVEEAAKKLRERDDRIEQLVAQVDRITTDAAQNGADLAWYRMLRAQTRNMPNTHGNLTGMVFELVNIGDDPTLQKVREALAEFGMCVRAKEWDDFQEELAWLPRPRKRRRAKSEARKARP